MAATLTPPPWYVFVFAAVRRADRHPRICMLLTVAGDERNAAVPLSVTIYCSPLLPSATDGGVPCVIKKPLRPSQHVMTPVNTSALRLTIKLNRASAVSSLLG
ncbi:host cell division inhibitor Icd-like protein [Escherichia coli]|nr:host cell division inhibitor Icd-like protein [Escherichia coli]